MCVRVRVCACVRAYVFACVHACVRACVCEGACAHVEYSFTMLVAVVH
jgi:hypothetical protein